MGRLFLFILAALAVVALGCIQVPQAPAAPTQNNLVCNKPYIQVGTGCCLDSNDNGICDKDEAAPQKPEAKAGEAAKCDPPYIQVGADCCLDADSNRICDKDEPASQEAKPAESVKCEVPYILVGADCCLDADSNRICDKDEAKKVCPTDVQVCPGGSSVARDPDSSCNFYPCPAVFPEPNVSNASNTTNGTLFPWLPLLNLTLPKPACNYTPVLSAITSNLMAKSNECRSTRVNVLCGACSTCCSSPGVAKTEYEQSLDPTCYSCANSNFGVARARDYYDKMGAYEGICTENCPDLVTAYKAFLQYGKDYNCGLPEGWKICKDVALG